MFLHLQFQTEKKIGKYPVPKRDLNNYRIYTLNDIFSLQLVTYNHIDPKPIISVMYDKGFQDPKILGQMIDEVLSKRV